MTLLAPRGLAGCVQGAEHRVIWQPGRGQDRPVAWTASA
jgi:hypothetical protein